MVAFFQALLIFGGMILPQYRIWTDYIEKVQTAQADKISENGGSAAAAPVSSEDVQQLILMRNSNVFYSSAFIFVTCLVFGFYCSHRLGGPVFKTIQYLKNYRDGKETKPLSFRNGDFFHELADEINSTLQTKKK